jgi:hypothetical protein
MSEKPVRISGCSTSFNSGVENTEVSEKPIY